MTDNRFAPKDVTVKAGTPLTFVNEGANWHSVAGADGASTSISLGPASPSPSLSTHRAPTT